MYTPYGLTQFMNPEQEQGLVKQAQAGDKQALAALYDALTPKLLGYLVNVTKNYSLAEDILQSTWLKAIEALPRFQYRSNSKFSAWIFAIARNECKQHWRKSKTEAEFTEAQINSETDSHLANDHTTNDNHLMVEQMLSKLSEDDRELIRLRYIADLSLNDIANVLNINFVTVRVRLHRALNRARAQITPNT